jgi:hypothetical protein
MRLRFASRVWRARCVARADSCSLLSRLNVYSSVGASRNLWTRAPTAVLGIVEILVGLPECSPLFVRETRGAGIGYWDRDAHGAPVSDHR